MNQENAGKEAKEKGEPVDEVNTGRRNVSKAISSLPVLGAFFLSGWHDLQMLYIFLLNHPIRIKTP